MTKKFVVKLRQGGAQGNVVATSQVITLSGLGDAAPMPGDFVDGVMAGKIQTVNGTACFVKTTATPKYTIAPLEISNPFSNQVSITASHTAIFTWTTSLTGTTDSVSWYAVYPDTDVTYTGGGLETTSGTIKINGFSGLLEVYTLPVAASSQFQISLWSGQLGTSVLLARSISVTLVPIQLSINGPSTAVSKQPIAVTILGYANDKVNYEGSTSGNVTLNQVGRAVVDLTNNTELQPGIYSWTAIGERTPGKPKYDITVIDMFGKMEFPQDGTPGVPGTMGVPGVNAVPGVPGDDGSNAVPGTPGNEGIPGVPGSGPIIVIGGDPANVTVLTSTTTKPPVTGSSVQMDSLTYKVGNTLTKNINETDKKTIDLTFVLKNRTNQVKAEIQHITTDANDFENTEVRINSDSGTISFTTKSDEKTEGQESFRVLFYDEPSNIQFFQSEEIIIQDTSLTKIADAPANLKEYDPEITGFPTLNKLVGDMVKLEIKNAPPGSDWVLKQTFVGPKSGSIEWAQTTEAQKISAAATVRGARAVDINLLYYKHLYRMADIDGRDYWLNDMFKSGQTLTQVENNIKLSKEKLTSAPTDFLSGKINSDGTAVVNTYTIPAAGTYTFNLEFKNVVGTVKNGTMRQFVWNVGSPVYNMTIDPTDGTKDRYTTSVATDIVINVKNGPPNANIMVHKTASIAGWGGTDPILLDASGNYTSGTGAFGAIGTYNFELTLNGQTYIGSLSDRTASGLDYRKYIVTVTDGKTTAKTKYDPILEAYQTANGAVVNAGLTKLTTGERFGLRIRNAPPNTKWTYTNPIDNSTGTLTTTADGTWNDGSNAQVFIGIPKVYTWTITFIEYGNTIEFVNTATRQVTLTVEELVSLKVTSDKLDSKLLPLFNNKTVYCTADDVVEFTFTGPKNTTFFIEELTAWENKTEVNDFFIYYPDAAEEFKKANSYTDNSKYDTVEGRAFASTFHSKNIENRFSPEILSLGKKARYFDFYPEAYESWNLAHKTKDPLEFAKLFYTQFGASLKKERGYDYSPDAAINFFKTKTEDIVKTKENLALNADGVLKLKWNTSKKYAKALPYRYRAALQSEKGKPNPNWVYFGLRIDLPFKLGANNPYAASLSVSGAKSPLKANGKEDILDLTIKELQMGSIEVTGNSDEKCVLKHIHPIGVRGNSFNAVMKFEGSFTTQSSYHTVNQTTKGVGLLNGGGGLGPGVVINEKKWPIYINTAVDPANSSTRQQTLTSLQQIGFPAGPVGIADNTNPRIGVSPYQFVSIHWGNDTTQIFIGSVKDATPITGELPITIFVLESGKSYSTIIPGTSTEKPGHWKNPQSLFAPLIDIYTGFKGPDPLDFTGYRTSGRSFTLVITNTNNAQTLLLNNSILLNEPSIVGQIHPYMQIYPEALSKYKTSGGTKSQSQYAVNHWNETGKNLKYINPYRIQALIALPYFNYNPDVEAAFNSGNPTLSTEGTNFNLVAAQIFADNHFKTAGVNEKRKSPTDIATQFNEEAKAENIPFALNKDTKNYKIEWKQQDHRARTIPYMYTLDGDKSDNVIIVRAIVTEVDNLKTAASTVVLPETPIAASRTQPPAARNLSVIVNPAVYIYKTYPISLQFIGEPDDTVYIEYIDPKFQEDRLYIEHNRDLYDWYEANKSTQTLTLRQLSESHYQNFGKKEGRKSIDELIAYNNALVAQQVPKRAFGKIAGSGFTIVPDITEGGRFHYEHRVTPYTYRFTADKSQGSQTISVTVNQAAVAASSASAASAAKLLRVREFKTNAKGSYLYFFIGDLNEKTLPQSVKITCIETNIPTFNTLIKVGDVIFDYPAKQSYNHNVQPDKFGNLAGGINTARWNIPSLIIKFRIEVISAGGTWTSSTTTNPTDLTFVCTGDNNGAFYP